MIMGLCISMTASLLLFKVNESYSLDKESEAVYGENQIKSSIMNFKLVQSNLQLKMTIRLA